METEIEKKIKEILKNGHPENGGFCFGENSV